MRTFTQTLKVSPLTDGINWVLLETFSYDVDEMNGGGRIVVPQGFVTDFASIPRYLWVVLPKWGIYGNAAVIHDFLYWDQRRPRAEADKIMLEAMEVLNVPAWQRLAIYNAVNLFGGLSWKRNKLNREQGFERVIPLEQVELTTSYQYHRPNLVEAMLTEYGVKLAPSSKQQVIAQNPNLKARILALAGLKVRHGDVIDAVTPIFAEVSPDLQIVSKPQAPAIGGTGGGETILEREGCLITGFNLVRGVYFGRDEVIHLEVIWQKLTPTGLDSSTETISQQLGSGNYAEIDGPPQQIRVKPGYYIADLKAHTSDHTSGETFLHHLDIQQEKLPGNNAI